MDLKSRIVWQSPSYVNNHAWICLDMITCNCLVISVGLCVDFSVHIAHAFQTGKGDRYGGDFSSSAIPHHTRRSLIILLQSVTLSPPERNKKLIRRKIRLTESNAKCRYLKKFTCIGTLRQVFICLRHPPLLGFWLDFVGSESSQIQYTVYNSCICSPHNPIPPPHYTLYKYTTLYIFTQGRGVGEGEANQWEG
jgi:hypothetical protein